MDFQDKVSQRKAKNKKRNKTPMYPEVYHIEIVSELVKRILCHKTQKFLALLIVTQPKLIFLCIITFKTLNCFKISF